MAFVNKQKTWFESPMGTHDPGDIAKEVNSSWELVSRQDFFFLKKLCHTENATMNGSVTVPAILYISEIFYKSY